MCGIVGMAGDLEFDDKKGFEDMLVACQVRGFDSTGIMSVDDKTNRIDWLKMATQPYDLMQHKGFDSNNRPYNKKIIVGHTRAATIGPVNKNTAHPFGFNDICGVHNGTLQNWRTALDDAKDFEVDSECLYYNINRVGPELTFASLRGAWACVWYDKNDDLLYFLRNDERPLHLSWSSDGRRMYWASEPWMLLALERRDKIKLMRFGDHKEHWCISLNTDELWAVKIDASNKDKVFTVQSKKEVRGESRGVNQGTNGCGNNRTGMFWNYQTQQHEPMGFKPPADKKGGEGAAPFPDDDIPDFLKAPVKPRNKEQGRFQRVVTQIRAESGSGSDKKKSFSTSSKKNSDRKSGQSNTDNFSDNLSSHQRSRPTLSLIVNNRNVRDEDLETSIVKPSVRTVAGIRYITNPETGNEVPEQEYFHNLGVECTFCRHTIQGVEEVFSILPEGKGHICTHCVEHKGVAL